MANSKKYLNIVGPNIKRIRTTNPDPITQEKLAIELQLLGWNIDRFGISKIERGKRTITDKELLLIAKVLGIGVEELF